MLTFPNASRTVDDPSDGEEGGLVLRSGLEEASYLPSVSMDDCRCLTASILTALLGAGGWSGSGRMAALMGDVPANGCLAERPHTLGIARWLCRSSDGVQAGMDGAGPAWLLLLLLPILGVSTRGLTGAGIEGRRVIRIGSGRGTGSRAP